MLDFYRGSEPSHSRDGFRISLLTLGLLCGAPLAAGAAGKKPPSSPALDHPAPVVYVRPVSSAIVNFAELARQEAARPPFAGPQLSLLNPELEESDEGNESGGGELDDTATASPLSVITPHLPAGPAPGPAQNFIGMDASPKAGGATNFLSPDTNGAIGLDKVLVTLNNNYQVQRKSDGVALSTRSIDAVWIAAGATQGALDPKTLYDPVNNRWIVAAITDFNSASATAGIGVGVSLTSDPEGSWYLQIFPADPTGNCTSDFPTLGFNKNWVAVGYGLTVVQGPIPPKVCSTTQRLLMLDYPQLRAGVFSAAPTVLTANGSVITSPAATYDPAEPRLYAPAQLSLSSSFRVNYIDGTPSAPVFHFGNPAITRSQYWTEPGGGSIPQAAPLSGASACGATPCPIVAQDANIRQTPVVRGGFLYFSQTVGLPAGGSNGFPTRTGVQWTKFNLAGNVIADEGRIEDPTAAGSNGGKWYDASHLAVNQFGDILLGFTQFSSAQYASAGYSFHSRTDPAGAGVMSAPFIFKAGEDYYHRTASAAVPYNRWGDYSKAQVDPVGDTDLWVIQEYAKARVGTDDSNGLATNSSRWGTWLARVAPVLPTETAPGNGGAVTGQQWSGKTTMTWAVNATATSGYRLYRGVAADLPRLLTGAGNACLRFTGADQNANSAAGLVDDPSAAGGLYWYLVVGDNLFGEGPAGNATAGPRLINSGGNCP
jgi:hypothetical protein